MLDNAPAGNENEVVAGKDGFYRFTPVVAGDYSFRIAGGSETRTISVVSDVPYEHYNYYATSSMADVDGEMWVTDLYDAHISRIDPAAGTVKGRILTGPWPSAVAYV